MEESRIPGAASDEPNLVAAFRGLVLLYATCYVAYYFLPYVEGVYFLQDWAELLAMQGAGALLVPPPVVYFLMGGIALAVSFGLFSFSPQARFVFAAMLAFTLVLSAIGGVSVGGPLSAVVGGAMTLAQGAVVALSYLPPLSRRFRK